MKKETIIKYLLFILFISGVILCSSCAQSPQEEEGINLLPQNRPIDTNPGTIGRFQF